MSFLIDPPLLYANGRAYGRLAPDAAVEGEPARAAGVGLMAIFYVVSVALYMNMRWIHWLARLCRAESGRDWMLNSGVLQLDHRRAGPGTHLVAALIFATYPLWLLLGFRHGLRARGQR